MRTFIIVAVLSIFMTACDQNDVSEMPSNAEFSGTGAFNFDANINNSILSMNIFYHIPESTLENMPILFVFHGGGRNARGIRNAWIEESEAKDFIVIAPEFSDQNFPGGDAYNLGNVFEDGDNPSPSTLNSESNWTFSIIEPLFDEFKIRAANTSLTYKAFGFSAGAQFLHRFMMFKTDARVEQMVASAAGWYTVPDFTTSFPYGYANSPLEDLDLSRIFSKSFTIQIGTLDNQPDAPSLRRNPVVDLQGDNRLDRAYYMFNTSKTTAENSDSMFNWELLETQGNGHNLEQSIPQASELLFGP
jgi:hypothetical protein